LGDCDQALKLDAKDREADCDTILAGDPQSSPALDYPRQIRQARGGKTARAAAPGPKPN
jgi:hypothetical protein